MVIFIFNFIFNFSKSSFPVLFFASAIFNFATVEMHKQESLVGLAAVVLADAESDLEFAGAAVEELYAMLEE